MDGLEVHIKIEEEPDGGFLCRAVGRDWDQELTHDRADTPATALGMVVNTLMRMHYSPVTILSFETEYRFISSRVSHWREPGSLR